MMDATGRARRSDALFYDGVTMHRRDLCDLVALRESRVEELEAENEKLRKDIAETTVMLGAAWEQCGKLRKLLEWAAVELRMSGDASDPATQAFFYEICDMGIEVGV